MTNLNNNAKSAVADLLHHIISGDALEQDDGSFKKPTLEQRLKAITLLEKHAMSDEKQTITIELDDVNTLRQDLLDKLAELKAKKRHRKTDKVPTSKTSADSE